MDLNHKSDIFAYQNAVFDKLYYANTLVNMTKVSCLNREFSGQYYGATPENSRYLSNERNEYVAMLNLISDKLSDIQNIDIMTDEYLLN